MVHKLRRIAVVATWAFATFGLSTGSAAAAHHVPRPPLQELHEWRAYDKLTSDHKAVEVTFLPFGTRHLEVAELPSLTTNSSTCHCVKYYSVPSTQKFIFPRNPTTDPVIDVQAWSNTAAIGNWAGRKLTEQPVEEKVEEKPVEEEKVEEKPKEEEKVEEKEIVEESALEKHEKEEAEQKLREEREKHEKEESEAAGTLAVSTTGSDSGICVQSAPCKTFNRAYEVAKAGQTVKVVSGNYPAQAFSATSKVGAAVVFTGSGVTVTGTINIFASHIKLEGLTTQDVTLGNFDESPGRINPTDITLKNVTGRNFQIDSTTNVIVEGGSWGPASACGGPYGGSNNSIRETVPGVAPENIVIKNTVIHDVQSYNLTNCHIEGLAIFAGNHVTVENSKFYGNSIYDIFVQANSGGSPNNLVIKGNWLADAIDNSDANGVAVGSHNGISFGSEIASNLTLEANHMTGIVNINDDGSIKAYTNTSLIDNVGKMAYNNYPCVSELKGVTFTKNIWQNDKCSSSDVNLEGAAYPYVNTAEDFSLNYTLTGKFAKWPEEEKAKEEKPAGKLVVGIDTGGWQGGLHKELTSLGILNRRISTTSSISEIEVAGGKVAVLIVGSPGQSAATIRSEFKTDAQKYPNVRSLEDMNEPSINGESAQAYAESVKAAREGITESGNKTVKLLAEYGIEREMAKWGSITPFSTADEIVQHAYGSNAQRHIEEAHNATGRPIAVTETGFTTAVGQPNTGDSVQMSEAQQASEIEKRFAWAKTQTYIGIMIYFNAVDYGTNNFYGIKKSNLANKPSAAVLGRIAKESA